MPLHNAIIREARFWHPGDVLFLRTLRNSLPDYERVSLTSHLLWLFFEPPAVCLLAYVGGKRIGYCRVSMQGVVSIALAEGHRGKGIGRDLIRVAQRLKPWWLKRYVAHVAESNRGSRLLFGSCGFIPTSGHSQVPKVVFYWPSLPREKDNVAN